MNASWTKWLTKTLPDVRLGVAMVFIEYKDLAMSDDPSDGMLMEWVPIKAEFASAAAGKKNSASGGTKKSKKGGGAEADEVEVGSGLALHFRSLAPDSRLILTSRLRLS